MDLYGNFSFFLNSTNFFITLFYSLSLILLKFLNNIILIGISYKWLNNKEAKVIPLIKPNTNETVNSGTKNAQNDLESKHLLSNQAQSESTINLNKKTNENIELITSKAVQELNNQQAELTSEDDEDSAQMINAKKKPKRKPIITSNYFRCKRLVIYSCSYSKMSLNNYKKYYDNELKFTQQHKIQHDQPKLID